MRGAIHSPYLDTLGGGERYISSFAKILRDHDWDVDLESSDQTILIKINERLGIDLDGIRVVKDIKRGSGYDLCFWLSDGSVPTLHARNNILHFQRPFFKVEGKSLINRMKFVRINKVVVNSNFTKNWIDKEFPIQSIVIYPPVDTSRFKPQKKENLILSIGRFSQLEQAKRQDILVKAFKKLYDSGVRDYRFVLAGGSDIGRTNYLDKIIKNSKGYPIKVLENPSFRQLRDLYGIAKFFWSASGYGVDEAKEPQKVEHFGIALVEAMSAGCVPLAYDAGGHREIIETKVNGYLWMSVTSLLNSTRELISDSSLFRKIVTLGKESSKKYSYDNFEKQILEIL